MVQINKILFGTAGIPKNSPVKTSAGAPEFLRKINLDTMELEFVRSVSLNEKRALEVKKEAVKNNIRLSCHAPYYINLNSKEQEKIEASMERILKSARILNVAGGQNVVFHSGFFQDIPVKKSIENTVKNLMKIRQTLDREGLNHIILRPEMTGKQSQIGSEQVLAELCREIPGTLPCIDFSHFQARYNNEKSFEYLFDFLSENIPDFFQNIHCHLSGIDYGLKGEIKHINLEESKVDYKKIINLLIKYNAQGTVICESPSLEEDALILKNYYLKKLNGEL